MVLGQKGCEIEPKKKQMEYKVGAKGGGVKMETKFLFKPKRVALKFEQAWVDCFSRVCVCVVYVVVYVVMYVVVYVMVYVVYLACIVVVVLW